MISIWSKPGDMKVGSRLQILIVPIFFMLVLFPAYENKFFVLAQSQDCLSSLTTRIDSTYSGPVFLDSYWTDQGASSTSSTNVVKKEVGPGDGVSSLATVLVNRSTQDIYAVTGYLKLPDGFKPAGISGSQEAKALFDPVKGQGFTDAAIASFNAKIPAGETFTLYFDINATEQAKVGSYGASLIVKYYNANESKGCTSALLDVPFLLPGRVILDAVTTTQYLSTQSPNSVEISIENKGSSDATGVIATIVSLGDSGSTGNRGSGSSLILSSSSTSLVNLGANTFNIGTIPAYGKTPIKTTVYPNISAGGTVQNVGLQLSYGNAYGYRQNSVVSTGLVILPSAIETSLGISYDNENGSQIITAGKVEDLNFTVRNNGKSTLNNLVVSLSPESDSLKILGNSQWTFDTLEPNGKLKLSTTVFAAKTLIGSPTSFVVTADYITLGESKSDSLDLGLVVQPDSVGPAVAISYDENSSQIITSGKVEDLSFAVANNGKPTLSNVVISLSPESDALKILGNSKWTIPQLESGGTTKLSTKVFAAKTMIGTPTSFSITADYVSEGESKTDLLNLGAYVSGDIKLVVYDVNLSYVGNVPNISGNLLNQGSSTGMFASIELLPSAKKDIGSTEETSLQSDTDKARQSKTSNGTVNFVSSPQYLGDLTADSTIPFSVPIKSEGRISPGTYPLTFKIAYADDLKNFQEITLDTQVTVGTQPTGDNERPGSFFGGGQGGGNSQGSNRGSQPMFLPILFIAIGTGVVAFFVLRRRFSKRRQDTEKKNQNDDIETLLSDADLNLKEK